MHRRIVFIVVLAVLVVVVRSGAPIINASDCDAFVWPSNVTVPDWLNSSAAAIVPTLDQALTLANRSHITVCAAHTLLLPSGEYSSKTNATSVSLCGFGEPNSSWSFVPGVEVRGKLNFQMSVQRNRLTLQDLFYASPVQFAWNGSVDIDRLWSVRDDSLDLFVAGDLTIRNSFLSGFASAYAASPWNSRVVNGTNWHILDSVVNTALLKVHQSNEQTCDDRDFRCVNSSLALTNVTITSSLWRLNAQSIVLNQVHEEMSRHKVFADRLVVRDSRIQAYASCVAKVEICENPDSILDPVFFVRESLNKHVMTAKSAISVSDVVVVNGDEMHGAPFLNMLLGLPSSSYANFSWSQSRPQPTVRISNLTSQGGGLALCPLTPSILDDTGSYCALCPVGQMPDVRYKSCIPCGGPCDALQCWPGARWTGARCEACPGGLVFNGSACSCPDGWHETATPFANNLGILTCARGLACDGPWLGPLCLGLVNGVALGVVAAAVGIIVGIVAVVCTKKCMAQIRGSQRPYQRLVVAATE